MLTAGGSRLRLVRPTSVAFYDRANRQIDLDEWSRLLEDSAYRRVAEDTIGDFWVSTVWLGLDHNFLNYGPFLIYETMTFNKIGEPVGDLRRYATEEQALNGHREIVDACRETGDPSTH